MIASLMLLVLRFPLNDVDLKGPWPELGSPPDATDQPTALIAAQSTSGGAGSQSSPNRTQISAAVEEAARADVSMRIVSTRDGNQQRGAPPRHRACHQRAVHWSTLEKGPPKPMPSGAVHERLRARTEGPLVPSALAPWRARRGLLHLGSRATTPCGWYQLGGVSVLRLGDAGRGTAGYGITWGGAGSKASQPARRCPSTPRGPRCPTASATAEMTSPIDQRLRYLVLVDSMAFGTPVLIENVEEEIDSYAPRSPARTADHGAAHACYSRAPHVGTGRSGPCSPR